MNAKSVVITILLRSVKMLMQKLVGRKAPSFAIKRVSSDDKVIFASGLEADKETEFLNIYQANGDNCLDKSLNHSSLVTKAFMVACLYAIEQVNCSFSSYLKLLLWLVMFIIAFAHRHWCILHTLYSSQSPP